MVLDGGQWEWKAGFSDSEGGAKVTLGPRQGDVVMRLEVLLGVPMLLYCLALSSFPTRSLCRWVKFWGSRQQPELVRRRVRVSPSARPHLRGLC